MTLYERRTKEVVDADLWLGNGADHQYVQPYSRPNHDLQETHLKCKHRWVNHGWISPNFVKGQRSWNDGEVVCPGDYLILHEEEGRPPRFTVVHGPVFERTYAEQASADRPLTLPLSVWDSAMAHTKADFLKAAGNAGLLLIPDELLLERGHG